MKRQPAFGCVVFLFFLVCPPGCADDNGGGTDSAVDDGLSDDAQGAWENAATESDGKPDAGPDGKPDARPEVDRVCEPEERACGWGYPLEYGDKCEEPPCRTVKCEDDGSAWDIGPECSGDTPLCWNGSCVQCTENGLYCDGDDLMSCISGEATLIVDCTDLEYEPPWNCRCSERGAEADCVWSDYSCTD
jgi:hypothetical protein